MKKNEFVQIKGISIKELKEKAKVLKVDLANLTLDKNMKKLKDLKSIYKKKKDLAQILTVIRQKELLQTLESKDNIGKSNPLDNKVAVEPKSRKGDRTKIVQNKS